MTGLRHLALSVCILCALAGVIRIFWPENSFKRVINTVLLLYILASAFKMAAGTDWQAFSAEIAAWSGTAAPASDYSDYAAALGQEASAEGIRRLLTDHGINAEVTLRDGVCRIVVAQRADTARAGALMEENGGTLAYTITAEDGAS